MSVEDLNLSTLLYADDIALIAENEINSQNMQNTTSSCCRKWCLTINSEKTQFVHFRGKTELQSTNEFHSKV